MNLEAVLEGILFVSGEEGLTLKQIKNILETDKEELIKIIRDEKESYELANDESRYESI